MEKNTGTEAADQWEKKGSLVNELAQGRELAKQLQIHLNVTSSSHETRELLIHRILNSYDKALSILKSYNTTPGTVEEPPRQQLPLSLFAEGNLPGMASESPRRSFSGSPDSDDSDREYQHHHQQQQQQQQREDHNNTPRKRKNMPRWTHQVQVSPGTGLEGPLDDGYGWRKYGQKDILGAKYPRGYYRCTHKNLHGCLATKQVQRSDDDPTIFEITYRGKHTCSQTQQQGSHAAYPLSSIPPEKQEPTVCGDQQSLIPQPQSSGQSQQQLFSKETLLNFQTGLTVVTQDLETQMEQSFSSFYFPSTSNHVYPGGEEGGFSSSSSLNPLQQQHFGGKFSPAFSMSPATPESNYFSLASPSHVNGFVGIHNPRTSETELADLIPPATSTTNSPTVDVDYPFGHVEFDPNFTFNSPGFF